MKVILSKDDVVNENIYDDNGEIIGCKTLFKFPITIGNNDKIVFPVNIKINN